MKNKICVAVALVFFASCMKVKKKGDDESTPVATTQSGSELDYDEKLETNAATELSYQYLNTDTELPQIKFNTPEKWGADVVYEKSYEGKKLEDAVKFNSPVFG